MRIALVVHAFPPKSNTGVEVYSEALARAFVAHGHQVEVLACHTERGALHLEHQREERDGFGVTWLRLAESLDDEDQRRASPGAGPAMKRWLTREQPDVVHVQHFLGLGADIIDVVRAQEIPVLFTAHDGLALCDEYTLLGPDLRALDPSDRQALARCRLARGVLDGALEAHDGFLPVGAADTSLAREVQEVMGETSARVDELAVHLEGQLKARIEALDRADRILSPTRCLAQAMQRAGLVSEVLLQPCGIDSAALRAREETPNAGTEGGPLRVLYLGGYFEHKGVHVLLEAVRGLEPAVQLTLRGCAGSSNYIHVLEGLAQGSGAQLGGAFDRAELPKLLQAADLLALPSLWPENAPFVLREAFAAGVPVIVSDTPALRESVRDGVDGRLIRQGDVLAWRAALSELAADPQALATLRAGVRPPKSIEQDAGELIEIYAGLLQDRDQDKHRQRERLPEHLRGFAAQVGSLGSLPTKELSVRVIRGLLELAQQRSVSLRELSGAVAGLGASQGLRERIAEGRRALAWRDATSRDQERTLEATRNMARGDRVRADNESERALWQTGQLEDRDATIAALRAELELAQRTLEERERERQGGQRTLESVWAENQWLREQAEGLRLERDTSRLELEQKTVQQEHARAEIAELERQAADRALALQAAEAARDHNAQGLEQAKQHMAGIQKAHDDLFEERAAARDHERFLEEQLAQGAGELNELTGHLAEAQERLMAQQAELDWRAAEMRAAQSESAKLAMRFFGRGLGKRLSAWDKGRGGQW